jgi:hypothetical protein
MTQFYPGQQVIARDGARYTLTHYCEGTWWGQRSDGACALPQPVVVLYPAWGGDDERAGADCAPQRVRRTRRSRRGAVAA